MDKKIKKMIIILMKCECSNEEIMELSKLNISKNQLAGIRTWYFGKRKNDDKSSA